MKKTIIVSVFIIFCLLLATPLLAQDDDETPRPDYRVSVGTSSVSINEDLSVITVTVTVINGGDDATQSTNVELSNLSDGVVLDSEVLRPLARGQREAVELSFESATFAPGTALSLWVTVGIGDIETEDSNSLFDNRAALPPLTIPDYDARSTTDDNGNDGDGTNSDSIITIPVLEIEIDTSDDEDVLLVGGIIITGLAIIIIFLLILRVLFRRAPKFGNWQPPYATMPPMDPNSTYGRRQSWQQHAQNNTVPLQSQENTVHARKVLLGMDGYYLSGWRIRAMRLTQFDMYGRVARSEVVASRGQIRRLNRVARRNDTLAPEKINKRLRPVARQLVKQIRKKINKRSALLPIAVDLSFTGTHGEVRIVFELYQRHQNQLHQIDQWEPEMTVVSRDIYESYTFTIAGQTGGETYRMFRNRLADDLNSALTSMMIAQPAGTVPIEPTQQVETNAETPM